MVGEEESTIRSNVGTVKCEGADVSSEDGKPPLTSIGFECGVNNRRNKLLLIHHETNRSSATQHIDADQKPPRIRVMVLLLLAQQHRFNQSIKQKHATKIHRSGFFLGGNKWRQQKTKQTQGTRNPNNERIESVEEKEAKLGTGLSWVGLGPVLCEEKGGKVLRGRRRGSGSTRLVCRNRRRKLMQEKLEGEARSPSTPKGSASNPNCLGFLPFTTNLGIVDREKRGPSNRKGWFVL